MLSKILVVDDEPDVEKLICQKFRKQIRKKEIDFLFASNGVEALQTLQNDQDIDLVLSDINMPQMDGLTLLSKLSEIDNTLVKVVIVSAYGDMDNIRTAMNRGAYDFITKPIDFNDLEITINKTLQEQKALKQANIDRKKLDNIQQELNVASEIQQSIIPKNFLIFPQGSHFEIFAEMIPAKEVGGDFYDFFYVDKDRLGIVIGDVSGKGMPAALFMAISRTLIKATALKGESPNDCLFQVNNLLCTDNSRNMFVTLVYGILNIHTGDLEFCNGGHNLPYVLSIDGKIKLVEGLAGMALGVMEDFEYKLQKLVLQPEDIFFLYTDGVTEAMDSQYNEFSDARLAEYLTQVTNVSPTELIDSLIAKVKTFSGSAPQSDDITTLAIKRLQKRDSKEIAMGRKISIQIKNDLAELGKVNEVVDEFKKSQQLPIKIANALNIAIDEIITNIVSYGYEDQKEHEIAIRLFLDNGKLVLEIEDDARHFNPLNLPNPDTKSSLEERSIGGMGVHLVRNLMDEIEYTRRDEKNCLTMKKKI